MPAPFGLPAELAELQDDYAVVGELGRGGAAVVYRARDRALGRDVAIKVVHPRPTSPDDDPVARLGREARTVAQLHHPNIVAVYAVRRLRSGGLALVMQCVPGATLKTHVQRHGPLDPDACEYLLRDVGAALAYAHARGVVHRDVKPENIFLDSETGRALLADFGIAQSADSDSLTKTGTAVGTPFYMSPEQVDGEELDGRSDLYSLGLVAWEALTGRRPWDGDSLYNVIYKQKHEELPPIEALRPGVPMRLQYLVERMLQKRPAARWAGVEGLLGQLDHAVLPGDYGRWQRALRARVERYLEEEQRRGASRRGAPEYAAALGASTVQFPRGGTLSPLAGPLDGAPADGAAAVGAAALEAASAADPAGATAPRPVDGSGDASDLRAPATSTPAVRPAPGPATASPRRSDWADAVVPERGRTIDLRTPSGAAGGDPGSLHASYADSAEPTWATTPDEPEAKRRGPQDRRRRLLYAGAGTIAMAAVGLAFYGGEAPASSTVEQADTAAAAPDGRAPAGLAVGRDDRSARPPIAPAPAGAYLAAGGRHGCTMTVAGSLVCWGANDRGQLGDGTAAVQAGPVAVAGDLAFVSVSAGLLHTCAVTRLGDVYCWGADDRGQLGDATTIRRNAPVRIAGLGTYASVSAGAAHTCGVTTDGALRCWGANDQAQLGDGTRDSRSAPTPVLVGNAPVVSVAAGGQHTCAVTDDGRLYCWGANNDGQLGSGERGAYRAAPAPVAVAGRATSVTAGLAHSCALTGDGAVTCWGRVETGDARAGAPSGPAGPAHVRFADTVPVVAIASGGAHACALTAVGRVWCWGRNTRGALGDGTTRPRSEPVRVALPGPAVAVTAGNAHTCAALASGRTYCWGENQNGQLGDPMRTARFVPAPVRFPAGVRPLGGRAAPPVAVGSPPTTTAP